MSSFTTSLKDTLSDLASKASSNTTNTSIKDSSNPQTSTSTTSDNNQNNAQDAIRGLVGLIPVAQSLFVRSTGHDGSGDGSGRGSGGLLPVNQDDGPDAEKKGTDGGSTGDGGHEEGATPFRNVVKNPMDDREKKSGCDCSSGAGTGSGTGTGAGKEECCANTGDCGNCKGCKESKDSGKYCQCQCKNQRSSIGGEGCGCQGRDDSGQKQDQDESNTQREEYDGKSSSFRNVGAGAGLGAGAGRGEDYGSNNPLGQTDAGTTASNVSHQFSGGESDDFNPSPSAITAATDELIAASKNESESGGRGTGGYTGSGALGGGFAGQD